MRLLVDSDIFCKLVAAGLFEDAAKLVGGDAPTVECLAALPHMLRKGRLRKQLGDEAADSMLKIAEALPVVPAPPSQMASLLTGRDDVDPGEVHLLSVAANEDVLLLTGDKRALKAVSSEPFIVSKLTGKVVSFEAILLALVHSKGDAFVRKRLRERLSTEKMVVSCFSDGNPSSASCLESYFKDLRQTVQPLILWAPEGGKP